MTVTEQKIAMLEKELLLSDAELEEQAEAYLTDGILEAMQILMARRNAPLGALCREGLNLLLEKLRAQRIN